MRFPTLFLCLLFCQLSFAQNLVPNPSFEELRNLPVKKNKNNYFRYEPRSGFIPYKINLESWLAASITTPDLRIHSPANYNECKRKFKVCDIPRTGENAVGIITFQINSKVETYREYLQIKLKEPLNMNDTVYVELWVAKEREAKLVSNNIGVHFAMKRTQKKTKGVIDLVPHINIDTLINEDKQHWVRLYGSFVPDKPYKYVMIGNFFDNDHTEVKTYKKFNGSPWTPSYAYYLIDDVRVWQNTPKPEPLVFDNKLIEANTPIELKNIVFDFDKYDLKEKSILELEKLTSFLHDNPKVNIEIHGHTDAEGSDDYNVNLSDARAKAVYLYLVQNGIDSNRMQYKGFGEAIPRTSNTSEENRAKNRRVEFIILDDSSNQIKTSF